MDEKMIKSIVAEIMGGYIPVKTRPVPVEISARHIHLSHGDVETLFGKAYTLSPERELSQPGQFLCKERVRLVGAQGVIDNVAVLGPIRSSTQIELSASDAHHLGITAPVRLSGNTNGAADLAVFVGTRFINAKQSAIIAQNHIHMHPDDALEYGVSDQESVRVYIDSERSITFEDVVVRVSNDFRLAMHIDYDEGNACAFKKGVSGRIIKKNSLPPVPGAKPFEMAEKPSHTPSKSSQYFDGKLVTSLTAEKLCGSGPKMIYLTKGTILTPSAKDVFRQKKAELVFLE